MFPVSLNREHYELDRFYLKARLKVEDFDIRK